MPGPLPPPARSEIRIKSRRTRATLGQFALVLALAVPSFASLPPHAATLNEKDRGRLMTSERESTRADPAAGDVAPRSSGRDGDAAAHASAPRHLPATITPGNHAASDVGRATPTRAGAVGAESKAFPTKPKGSVDEDELRALFLPRFALPLTRLPWLL
jgi:hypothetical protein